MAGYVGHGGLAFVGLWLWERLWCCGVVRRASAVEMIVVCCGARTRIWLRVLSVINLGTLNKMNTDLLRKDC